MKKINSNYKQYYLLAFIILLGFLVRLFFQVGHIFSDDAYYSYLSYTLINGDFAKDYLGYPVFPLRIAFIGLTSLSMKIFGTNEFATIIFPLVFSLANILLVYKFTRLFTGSERTALYAAFLIAFFPTDVIFASVNFPDLINIFFINLGIYFLLNPTYQQKNSSRFYRWVVTFPFDAVQRNYLLCSNSFDHSANIFSLQKKTIKFSVRSLGLLFISR